MLIPLAEEKLIKWPNMCAYCGTKATEWAKASCTQYSDYRYYIAFFQYTRQRYSIFYPVCNKHKRLCSFLDLPYKLGLSKFFLAYAGGGFILFGLFALIGVLAGFKVDAVDLLYIILLSVIGFIVTLVIIFVKKKPIRIPMLLNFAFKLDISREDFFQAFVSLNTDIIRMDKGDYSRLKVKNNG